MTLRDLADATIHVNGIHSSPTVTIDFDDAQTGLDDLATQLVLLFKGTLIFISDRHIVLKTDKSTFEDLIHEMMVNFLYKQKEKGLY